MDNQEMFVSGKDIMRSIWFAILGVILVTIIVVSAVVITLSGLIAITEFGNYEIENGIRPGLFVMAFVLLSGISIFWLKKTMKRLLF